MVFVSATCGRVRTQGLLERGVAVVTVRGVVLFGISGDRHWGNLSGGGRVEVGGLGVRS